LLLNAKRFIRNAPKTLPLFLFAPQMMYHANDVQPQVKQKNRLD